MTKILIVGAGAIGGFYAARLAQAGHDVTVLARGAHLKAIQQEGLRLETQDKQFDSITQVKAISDLEEAQAPDMVMVTLKAYQVAPIVDPLARIAAQASIFMPIQNGIGWWYFLRHGGLREGTVVKAVDPQGHLVARLPVHTTIPAFAFMSAQVVAPGVVRHISAPGDHLAMGELDGTDTDRLRQVGADLELAGIKPKYGDVRTLMWHNVVRCEPTRALALDLMREVCAVACSLGHDPGVSLEARLQRAEAMSAAKPSMLQDLEAGRPMELDAILGALIEMAGYAQVQTPVVKTLHACLRLVEFKNTGIQARPIAP